MTIRLEPKRPDEKRRYRHDWSSYLGDDTIASQTTTSSDVTITGADVDAVGGSKAIDYVVSGGTDGTTATITQAIITAAGDHETETFVIPVRDSDEPVSLSEAKDHLGVLDTSRDGLILGYISAARRYCENYSGHILVRRTVTDLFPQWGTYLGLTKRPFVAADAITYRGPNGVDADFADFYVVGEQVYPTMSFPALGANGNIRVEYTAGYANGECPEEARQAILMLVGSWFANREAVSTGNVNPSEVPLATTALLDSFKAMVC